MTVLKDPYNKKLADSETIKYPDSLLSRPFEWPDTPTYHHMTMHLHGSLKDLAQMIL
jgi:hypothetical protein